MRDNGIIDLVISLMIQFSTVLSFIECLEEVPNIDDVIYEISLFLLNIFFRFINKR